MSNFYSHAFNFTSATRGSVDVRTGLFTVQLPLAHLVGNDNLGPALSLNLNYSPLVTTHQGVGIGFSLFGFSRYDRINRLLTLASGEAYKVDETASNVFLRQQKLDTLRFQKLQNNAGYRIIHKSGEIEVLPFRADPVLYPAQLFSPLGRRLDLNWVSFGDQRRLESVVDESGQRLLAITYNAAQAIVTVWPGLSESSQFRLTLQGDRVTQVTQSFADTTLDWHFEYTSLSSGMTVLTALTSPTGMVERVIYDAQAQRFPDAAHLPPLPAVTQYTQYPQGGQPPSVISFTYSSSNYLGYGVNETWSPDQDTLYGTLTNYVYWTQTRCATGQDTVVTRRTYNKFHLATQEVVNQNGHTQTTDIDYYAQPGTFDSQPKPFQLPRTHTVTWSDGSQSRQEVTRTTFDDAGNPLQQIAPDGVQTDWAYYSALGAPGLCPTEPNGFTRFVRSKTVTPPAGSHAAPVTQTEYTYIGLPAPAGTPVRQGIARQGVTVKRDGQTLHTTRTDYVNDPASAEHGRVSLLTATLQGIDGNAYVRTHAFSFARQGEQLHQTVVFTSHDQLSTTTTRTQSRFSGRVSAEVDAQGNEMHYQYDALGRLLTRVAQPETAYAYQQQYSYGLQTGDNGTSSTTVSDSRGNQVRSWHDGMGRQLRHQALDTDAAVPVWHDLATQTHDAWGRISTATQHDTLPGGQTTASHVQRTFDNWGQLSLTTTDDGRQASTQANPLTLQTETRLLGPGQGRHVIQYNAQHLPVSVTAYDSQGTPQGVRQQVYDGLKRLRAATDELNRTTTYSYDVFDRLASTTLPDQTVLTYHYAPDSMQAQVTGLEVNGVAQGNQQFDGLGRLTQTRSGARTTRLHYSGVSPVPDTVTTADGQTLHYQYDPKLGFVMTQRQSASLQQDFHFDPATGECSAAQEQNGMGLYYSYFPSGRLRSESFRPPAGRQSRTTAFTYSAAGRVLTYTDATGVMQSRDYDTQGRLTRMADSTMAVSLTYDAMGRLARWDATDVVRGKTLTTQLTFDDFNREVARTLSGEDTLHIAQTYQLNGLLSRSLTQRAGVTLRDEHYQYDSRNRLEVYTCSGSALPVDSYGHALTRQQFQYDATGNLTQCLTDFVGGSDTATYSYNVADPTQLTGVRHTGAGYPAQTALRYDGAGRLVLDEAGRTLVYDALGRLASVQGGGAPGGQYQYDARNRLVAQVLADGESVELYYRSGRLVSELVGSSQTRYLPLGTAVVAQSCSGGAQAGTQLLGSDVKGSVLVACAGSGRQETAYTAYGEGSTVPGGQVSLGYGGQRRDPVSGTYHLGNGYRAYNPVLMRFNAPDSWSPFGAGGINPYAYCLGDPINRSDPSGHLSWQAWLGIGLGVLGLVVTGGTATAAFGAAIAAEVGVAAALGSAASSVGLLGGAGVVADVAGIVSGGLSESNPGASAVLGWVSLGAGSAGLALSLARAAQKVGTAV
ncbi:RHS repeat-associated core domain-containing protein, partial [Serratia fonticola]|uniref:RHS repeat-associated core domain-containing protein n=1 Tax=Serratia fonticola TaxID=47917 RepID=UPI00301C170A